MAKKQILFTRYEIRDRIRALAKEVASDYEDKELTIIAVLNGGVMVAADLLRTLWELDFEDVLFDTIKVSSYGLQTSSSGEPYMVKDIRLDIKGRHVVIVEDIIDTGLTLQRMVSYMQEKEVASVEILALLAKPEGIRKAVINAKYVGFHIDNVWVEGYGIDSAERGRGNPNIMRVLQVD